MPSPAVSIIVPVFNRWDLTRRCLESLVASASRSKHSAEIVLADDGSVDETSRAWSTFAGGAWPVRYYANSGNLGFLRTCNRAAGVASGRYLCFLNNDVAVSDGWLDTLVARLESDDRFGAIGPMFLDESGRILECGGMVHSDGTARQLGRGALSDDRRYQFLNDVDYISGACLMVKADLFRALGGFDDRYAPCYYEDTDLCLQIAERGLRVVVEPRVRVVHREGSSSGVDHASGPKRYQTINRDRFFAKWRNRLGLHHPSSEEQRPDRIRIWRRGVVLMCHCGTWPGASRHHDAECTGLLTQLAALGHHVVAVFANELRARDETLQAMGIEILIATDGDEAACKALIRGYRPRAALFLATDAERRSGRAYVTLSPSTIRIVRCPNLSSRLSAGQSANADLDEFDRDVLADFASVARSDLIAASSKDDKRVLTDRCFFEPDRVVVLERQPGETACVNVEALVDAIGRAARGRRDPRWRLAQRMLWQARGRPGSLVDLEQKLERLTARGQMQEAVLEQYQITLRRLAEAEARLQRDLTQSRAAEKGLRRS